MECIFQGRDIHYQVEWFQRAYIENFIELYDDEDHFEFVKRRIEAFHIINFEEIAFNIKGAVRNNDFCEGRR